MDTAVESRQLRKVFLGSKKRASTVAVDSLDLKVPKGEVFGLLGPNGAGKTTTVRMLNCLIRPTKGEAWIGGKSILSQAREVRAICGVLTETPGLYARLNAVEYLSFFGRLYGIDSDRLKNRVSEVLDMLGIESGSGKDKRLGTFSRGMQQKMNIARAVLHEPAALFLDEPTASLDPESAKVVRDYILMLKGQKKSTVILCTHNLDEADRLCDRIGVIHRGKLLRVGKPEELKKHLSEHYTYRIRLAGSVKNYVAIVQGVSGVNTVELDEDRQEIVFRTSDPETVNPLIIQALVRENAKLLTISEDSLSLEEVYLALMKEQET